MMESFQCFLLAAAMATLLLIHVTPSALGESLNDSSLDNCQYQFVTEPPAELPCNPYVGLETLTFVCKVLVRNVVSQQQIQIIWHYDSSFADGTAEKTLFRFTYNFNANGAIAFLTTTLKLKSALPGFYYCTIEDTLNSPSVTIGSSTPTQLRSRDMYDNLQLCEESQDLFLGVESARCLVFFPDTVLIQPVTGNITNSQTRVEDPFADSEDSDFSTNPTAPPELKPFSPSSSVTLSTSTSAVNSLPPMDNRGNSSINLLLVVIPVLAVVGVVLVLIAATIFTMVSLRVKRSNREQTDDQNKNGVSLSMGVTVQDTPPTVTDQRTIHNSTVEEHYYSQLECQNSQSPPQDACHSVLRTRSDSSTCIPIHENTASSTNESMYESILDSPDDYYVTHSEIDRWSKDHAYLSDGYSSIPGGEYYPADEGISSDVPHYLQVVATHQPHHYTGLDELTKDNEHKYSTLRSTTSIASVQHRNDYATVEKFEAIVQTHPCKLLPSQFFVSSSSSSQLTPGITNTSDSECSSLTGPAYCQPNATSMQRSVTKGAALGRGGEEDMELTSRYHRLIGTDYATSYATANRNENVS